MYNTDFQHFLAIRTNYSVLLYVLLWTTRYFFIKLSYFFIGVAYGRTNSVVALSAFVHFIINNENTYETIYVHVIAFTAYVWRLCSLHWKFIPDLIMSSLFPISYKHKSLSVSNVLLINGTITHPRSYTFLYQIFFMTSFPFLERPNVMWVFIYWIQFWAKKWEEKITSFVWIASAVWEGGSWTPHNLNPRCQQHKSRNVPWGLIYTEKRPQFTIRVRFPL